jgi:hypothetical protein
MQPDFMALLSRLSDHAMQPPADVRAWPESAAKQDIPAIQTGRFRTQHFDKKCGPDQSPQVPTHVVRTDTEKECGMNSMSLQNTEQARNTITRSAKCIDINSQSDCDFRFCPVKHSKLS